VRILKWIGIVLGVLIGIIVIAVLVLNVVANRNLNGPHEVAVETVEIPTDEAAIARGQYLATTVSLCSGCHGENLGGEVLIDEAPIGYIAAPNLTAGQGGIGATYTDVDWVRALRHGVGSDGRAMGVMPSQWFHSYGDEDLGALIAYLKSVPPVDNELGPRRIDFPGTILFGVLGFSTLPYSLIDHTDQPTAQPAGATAEYGDYMTRIGVCRECHGAQLAGNTDPNGPPLGPNLTPGGDLATWSQDDFMLAIRNGLTPDGQTLDPEAMPWPAFANMSDEELEAIWLYLQTLPARKLGDN
jgi:mono/diheme cytochrome c family protein